jgi:hypothetical protein
MDVTSAIMAFPIPEAPYAADIRVNNDSAQERKEEDHTLKFDSPWRKEGPITILHLVAAHEDARP